MNTCPDCKNYLVCHDQGECLRSTPETDEEYGRWPYPGPGVHANFARRLERERNKAREQLASEKATRNAIIAKGIETERQLAEAREENARLREAAAVTQALAEWSKRYPRGVIYSASNRQMDAELIKLEELAKQAAEKLNTATP